MPNLRGIDVRLSYQRIEYRDVPIVTFEVDEGPGKLTLPILLDDPAIDQADYIRVARAVLHRVLKNLAEETKVWDLSVTELADLHAPGFPKASARADG